MTCTNVSPGDTPQTIGEPSVRSGERVRSRSEIEARAARAAGALARLGVVENDVVALLLRNDFTFFEASLAAEMLGAYAVPINWHGTVEEVAYILEDSGASILVAHSDLLAALPGLSLPPYVYVVSPPPEIAAAYGAEKAVLPDGAYPWWDDVAAAGEHFDSPSTALRTAMVYTSGTTGKPKGMRRAPMTGPVAARMRQRSMTGYGFDAPGRKCILMNGPMYHAGPNVYGMLALRTGADIVLQPRFSAEELLQLIELHRVTHMHIVPIMMHRLLALPADVRARYDLSSLVDVVHGAAPCPPDVKRAMIEWWGPVINEYYGSSETGLVTRLTSVEAIEHPGTVGRSLPGVMIRILDADRQPVGVDVVGDIYVRSENTDAFDYHGEAAARSDVEVDGFVTVGDMGFVDGEGYLHLSDRKRDMIISGGVNIYPAEVEAALMGIDGVRDCAVFGAPDAEFGECVVAHVELAQNAAHDAASLRQTLAGRIARYKLPKTIVFEKSLPRQDSGKVFKRRIRDAYWTGTDRKI